ncbi:MAG TPA: nuclear transport factor 2 family protein [Rhizomicrobium sp.]|nr:nuclear transport factor 2 family protein [Rhizomicrobium sp.]
MTQEQSNKALMLAVIAALKEGDLEPLFAALSPDVVWKATAPREFFRFGGIHHGVAGVREYSALLFSRYHVTRLEPKAVTAQGDRVWGLYEAEALHQPSGRYVQFDIFLGWTVKGGQIVQHQCLFDTASVLIQQGELKEKAA